MILGYCGCVAKEIACVTLTAIQAGMFSIQRVTGEGMIECISTTFPVNQRKVPPLVLDMASLAFAIRLLAVETGTRLQTPGNRGVACQTLIGHEFALDTVAFCAILNSFERRVRTVKFAG